MRKRTLLLPLLLFILQPLLPAQLSPAITSWLQNTTETGQYYLLGNSTLIQGDILVNCQKVEYTNDFVYVTATGIPAYPTGPFGNRALAVAENQNGLYKIPLNPVPNTGTLDNTVGGNIGIFINGTATTTTTRTPPPSSSTWRLLPTSATSTTPKACTESIARATRPSSASPTTASPFTGLTATKTLTARAG